LDGTNATGTWSIDTTGNAATATNVPYTGLTGTVPTWNQNTTGNAATATTITTVLPTTKGGTGLTSFTADQIFYAGSTSTLSQSANLQFDGTTLTTVNNAVVNGINIGVGSGSVPTNVAIGANALNANISGSDNTLVGHNVGSGMTAASDNTAVGAFTLIGTTGSEHTAFGGRALVSGNSGNGNTAIGFRSQSTMSTGSRNTSIGWRSMLAVSTGSNNTFIGQSAGSSATTGSNNVIIGSYSGVSSPVLNTGSNFVVLSNGAGAVVQYADVNKNTFFLGPIKTTGSTVANLTTLVGVTAGMRYYVTDALAPSFGVAVVGGGTETIPIFYNGTAWIVG
jgi:hypothetical protein